MLESLRKLEKKILKEISSDYKRYLHTIEVSDKGDFVIDSNYIFEVVGENKSFNQIKDIDNSYLVIDTNSTENSHKIPLWLFGFLY